jgi:hypothetical protein
VAGVVKKISILFLVATAGILSYRHVYAQQNTNVNFELCGSETPQLTINSPQSDSVTNTPNIVLSGTAIRTTQIEISLNGNFDQSIALGQDTDEFSTTITLQRGTNSIQLNAYYSCNGTTTSTNSVVTYQPGSSVSTGNQISTVAAIESGDSLPTISNPQESKSLEPEQSFPDRVAENLGLGSDINESIVRPIATWGAVFISICAAFIAISPLHIATRLFDFIGWKTHSELSRGRHLIIRILFIIASILLFIFVQG